MTVLLFFIKTATIVHGHQRALLRHGLCFRAGHGNYGNLEITKDKNKNVRCINTAFIKVNDSPEPFFKYLTNVIVEKKKELKDICR